LFTIFILSAEATASRENRIAEIIVFIVFIV
jgi:hypothetical protein